MEFKMSNEAVSALEEIKKRYADPKSAVMPALYLVQQEHNGISDQGIQWVADHLGFSPVNVRELVTFYSMYHFRKNDNPSVGKYHFQVCRTLSCGIAGSKALCEKLNQELKLLPGEVSTDGMFSYEQVECLGSCGTAPVCQINDTFFENLTPEALGTLIERIMKEKPDLSFDLKTERLGEGFSDIAKSRII